MLVLDDDPLIGAAVRRTLAGEHEIVTLTSAREALDALGSGERFDVILCDVMMPHVTGAEFYDQLARISPRQAESVVFVTGGAFTANARALLDEVPNARIEKPFKIQDLRALVNERVC